MDVAAKPTDEALLASALQGDQGSWDKLVFRYSDQGFGYTYAKVSDTDAAEEIIQEHWAQLVNALNKTQPDSFRSFFWTLLRRRIADWVREKKRSRELATLYAPINGDEPDEGLLIDLLASDAPEPSDRIIVLEKRERINHALMQLPEKYRLTLQARLQEDRSVQDTVKLLLERGLIDADGDLEKQVYNLQFRAVKHLAKVLRELGFERGEL